MSFTETATRAVRDAFRLLGQSATYTPDGGAPISTTVVVIPRVEEYPSGDRRLSVGSKDDVLVKLEDVPNPRRGDSIVVGGTTYTVDGEQPADRSAFAVRLQVHVA